MPKGEKTSRRKSRKGTVSIIIVTRNQFAYTRQCLESIRKNTPKPYEIVVVDNGSSDETVGYLKAQKDLRLISNSENRGYPAAANQGIQAARGDFLLFLNNDVVVPGGWLDRLMKPLTDHPDLGLVSLCSNQVSGPQKIPVGYSDLKDMDQFAQQWARENAGRLQWVDRLVGFCLLVRRAVIDRIGLWDERFGIGNFEDDDFCRRAIGAGFKCAIARDAFVHHFGSATFRGEKMAHAELMRKNRRLYDEKWGAAAPPPRLPPVSQPAKISLCMIVRDSSATLAACLTSIEPWVDEMIVVDTGSKDNTMEIARSLGARVFEFPWCDSFAAARNESLRHATGDWIFWMDSDDTIDAANGRKLRDLAGRSTDAMGFIMQVYCPPCPPAAGNSLSSATTVDHVKMFRRHDEIRFTGRIHEQILPAIRKLGGDVEWTDIAVVHSGSDQSPAGRARKHQRDLRLLEAQLAETPDDTFTLFNLGMTLIYSNRPADALNALSRSLQLATPAESHCRKIFALLVQAYMDLGRNATALITCAQGLAHFPADAELLFRKGQILLALGKPAEAEQAFRSLIDGPHERYFSSFDRDMAGVKAWHNLAVALEKQGKWKEAEDAIWKLLSFNRANRAAWIALLEALSRQNDLSRLETIAGGTEADVPDDLRLIARSRILFARKQLPAAIALLRDAMRPDAAIELLDELCRHLFLSDQLEEAQHWLTELTRRRPSDPSALLNLGTIYLRRGKFSEAEEYVRKSLELRPNYPLAERLLAEAREKGQR